MQVLKVIGLGTVFFVVITAIQITAGIVMGNARVATVTATSVSAMTAGLTQSTVYNPYFWLALLVAYGAAVWVVKN